VFVQIDAHYDEQKEQIQQLQLVMEQQIISDVNRVYAVSRHSCREPAEACPVFYSVLLLYTILCLSAKS